MRGLSGIHVAASLRLRGTHKEKWKRLTQGRSRRLSGAYMSKRCKGGTFAVYQLGTKSHPAHGIEKIGAPPLISASQLSQMPTPQTAVQLQLLSSSIFGAGGVS